MGYYRKDGENSFAIGVRQPDHGEGYNPYGISDEVWDQRVTESRAETYNYALYNAPPRTWQRMAVYFYLSTGSGRAAQQAVLAYTHDDVYKAMPGYKVLVSTFTCIWVKCSPTRARSTIVLSGSRSSGLWA